SPDPGSGATALYAGPDIAHFVGMSIQNGQLVTGLIDGASQQISLTNYDASAKYLQLHELGGTIAFETSPDGATYTQVGSAVASPTWISDAFITLSAGSA